MEAIVRESISSFLAWNNLPTPYQYGFGAGISTASQLNDWTQSIDHGVRVDFIYLDFSNFRQTISQHVTY